MVCASLLNVAVQYFAMNDAGLFQMLLVEHDFAKSGQKNGPNRVFEAESANAFECLIQQVNGSIDIARAPECNGDSMDHGESSRMIRTELVNPRLQCAEEFSDLTWMPTTYFGTRRRHFIRLDL